MLPPPPELTIESSYYDILSDNIKSSISISFTFLKMKP